MDFPTPELFEALELVKKERCRQHSTHGLQDIPSGSGHDYGLEYATRKLREARARYEDAESLGLKTFALIAEEEFWEVVSEVDAENLKEEVTQMAAVLVQWLEKLIRDEKK